jgi:subtilase family serine protease
MADLKVPSVIASCSGGITSYSYTVSNVGTAAAGSFSVRVLGYYGTVLGFEGPSASVSSLDVGASYSGSGSFATSSISVQVTADNTNTVSESSETNNVGVGSCL